MAYDKDKHYEEFLIKFRLNRERELDEAAKSVTFSQNPDIPKRSVRERLFWWANRNLYPAFIRKRIGNFILSHEIGCIRINIDLSHMTKEQNEHFNNARGELIKAGIHWDGSGYGPNGYDMNFGPFVSGAKISCIRCGYNTEDHRERYEMEKIKQFNNNCSYCGKKLTEKDISYKLHFWTRRVRCHKQCLAKHIKESSDCNCTHCVHIANRIESDGISKFD